MPRGAGNRHHRADQRCGGEAWRHGVDANALVAEFDRCRFGEAGDAGLRSGGRGAEHHRHTRVERCDVDDAPEVPAAVIWRAACFTPKNTLFRHRATVKSQSASVMSVINPGRLPPTTLNIASRPRSPARPISAATSFSFVTSQRTMSTPLPSSSCSDRSPASSMSPATTTPPSASRRRTRRDPSQGH